MPNPHLEPDGNEAGGSGVDQQQLEQSPHTQHEESKAINSVDPSTQVLIARPAVT